MPIATSERGYRRGFWMRTMVQWHWISSAVCLVAMLMFAITGITLNHAAQIETTPVVENQIVTVPESLLSGATLDSATEASPLPSELAQWLSDQLAISIGTRQAEWSEEEIYLSMPAPGSDAWLSIDRASGDVEYERTSRGWVAFFNDLHKGRNTGAAWKWLMDVFAVATLVFCFSGLFLLVAHARQRRMTWPLVGLGFVVPALVVLLLIH
ncbi:PepSY-associated TM helix domain-containing protein [Novipirellula galeiformis]